jgi:hypothetical protein
MVAALGFTLLLLPLGAFVALQARMDLLIQRNLRAEIEVFYVAEAGLEHAVAEIAPGTSFDAILAGPDRALGTADDGVFPFSEGPPAPFPTASFHYDVHITQRRAGVLDLISSSGGRTGATKVISAILTRSRLPFTPAAFYIDDASAFDLGSSDFMLSGLDHRITDRPTAPTGVAAAVPALATSRTAIEAQLRQRLIDNSGHLVGAGESPSIATTPTVDVQSLVSACAQRPHVSVAPAAVSMALGTVDAPQIAIAANDLEVTGQLTGAGILVVRGTLRVTGNFAFTGLIVALGGIVFEPSSMVQVAGAFWRAASHDPRVHLDGHGAVAYSSAALAAVDDAFPGLLPHPVVIAGWQEML